MTICARWWLWWSTVCCFLCFRNKLASCYHVFYTVIALIEVWYKNQVSTGRALFSWELQNIFTTLAMAIDTVHCIHNYIIIACMLYQRHAGILHNIASPHTRVTRVYRTSTSRWRWFFSHPQSLEVWVDLITGKASNEIPKANQCFRGLLVLFLVFSFLFYFDTVGPKRKWKRQDGARYTHNSSTAILYFDLRLQLHRAMFAVAPLTSQTKKT